MVALILIVFTTLFALVSFAPLFINDDVRDIVELGD